MSMMLQNWHRSSSRRKVAIFTMSPTIALTVSSPFATRWAMTEPGNAPAMTAPSLSSLSSIVRDPSALDGTGAADFFLQQQHAVEQCLGRGWTAGNVDIDRHDAIAAAHDRIGIVVITAAVGAGAHRDDVARLRHLVVDLAQRGRHLVGQRPGHNHHIGLARRGTRRETETLSIVSRHRHLHHLDRAAGKAERHPHERAGARPRYKIVAG